LSWKIPDPNVEYLDAYKWEFYLTEVPRVMDRKTTGFRGEGADGTRSKEYTRELNCVYPKALVLRRDLPAV